MAVEPFAHTVDCQYCGATVVGYAGGEPCPECGEVIHG